MCGIHVHVCPLQESWDYIGSSRMIYDMEQGLFPDVCIIFMYMYMYNFVHVHVHVHVYTNVHVQCTCTCT